MRFGGVDLSLSHSATAGSDRPNGSARRRRCNAGGCYSRAHALRLTALAVALIAAAHSAIRPAAALQWTSASVVVNGGNGGLFYPGVSVRFQCGAPMDVRVNNTFTDGTQLMLCIKEIGGPGHVQQIGAPIPAGTAGPYCDGCFTPNSGYELVVLDITNGNEYAVPYAGSNCSHAVITPVGSGANLAFTATQWTGGLYFNAAFWSTQTFMPWTPVTPWYLVDATTQSVTVQIAYDQTELSGYVEGAPMTVNVSESFYADGSNSRPVDPAPGVAAAPFVTAPFYFGAHIVNNQQLMSSASRVNVDAIGIADSDNSFFDCAFVNLRTGFVALSSESQYSAALECIVPASMASNAQNGDTIQLLNVTQFVTVNGVDSTRPLPFTPPGATPMQWDWVYPIPGPDTPGESVGLTAGQIFGILFGVFVGVAIIGFAGRWAYNRWFSTSGSTGAAFVSSDDAPQQVQTGAGGGYNSVY